MYKKKDFIKVLSDSIRNYEISDESIHNILNHSPKTFNINDDLIDSSTLLSYVVRNRRIGLIPVLITKGIDFNNKDVWFVLTQGAFRMDINLIQIMLNYGFNPSGDVLLSMLYCARNRKDYVECYFDREFFKTNEDVDNMIKFLVENISKSKLYGTIISAISARQYIDSNCVENTKKLINMILSRINLTTDQQVEILNELFNTRRNKDIDAYMDLVKYFIEQRKFRFIMPQNSPDLVLKTYLQKIINLNRFSLIARTANALTQKLPAEMKEE